MDNKQRMKIIDIATTRRTGIMRVKGPEYAGTDRGNDIDINYNFKELARQFGTSPEMILMIYLEKHLQSIRKFVRTTNDSCEGIISRIDDARNYLDILESLIREDEAKARGEELDSYIASFENKKSAEEERSVTLGMVVMSNVLPPAYTFEKLPDERINNG